MKTQYSLHRASTGRLTSGVDNSDLEKTTKTAQLQNVPRKLRDIVRADPGFVMIGADWAAIQWCLSMYEMSKIDEPRGFHLDLLERFQAGELDPHRYLASVAFEKKEDQVSKEERQRCKSYTFGRLFFGSPRTLAREAGHKDSVGLAVCNAHTKAFRPEPWWKVCLADCKRRKYVQSPGGWRCWFWAYDPKPTEVYAAIIQCMEGDLLKWTTAQIPGGDKQGLEWLTTTHDSLLFQAPKDRALESADSILELMQAPIPWLGWRTWRASVSVGDSWRDVS